MYEVWMHYKHSLPISELKGKFHTETEAMLWIRKHGKIDPAKIWYEIKKV